MNDLSQQRGAVPLMLDRPRLLFFDLAATFLLVEAYGIDFVSELYTVKTIPRLIDVTTTDSKTLPEHLKVPETVLALKSKEAFAYFLWAGLQADLDAGEVLTLEDVEGLVLPSNIRKLFYSLVQALTFTLAAPPVPGAGSGKAEAARPTAKRPAKKAPKKLVGSTSRKPKGTRSRR